MSVASLTIEIHISTGRTGLDALTLGRLKGREDNRGKGQPYNFERIIKALTAVGKYLVEAT
jgi:hypothetical protein